MKIVSGQTGANRSRPKRRRLKSLRFVPTLLTLGSLLCGFAAIYFALRAMQDLAAATLTHERALPPFLSVGAGLVVLGMVFDGLDGLIARATRSTTDFGGQLDSLADIVNCGVAPATLMLAFMIKMKEFAGVALVPSPISEHFLGRAVWVSAAIFVAFAAIRLARYNVEHAQADFDHRSFRGLPSPAAAAVVVALILFADDPEAGATTRAAVAYSLPVMALSAAFLMVSRIPYRRVNQVYLGGRKPFGQVVVVMVVFAVFWVYKAPTLLLVVIVYGLSGPFELLLRRRREKKGASTASSSIPETSNRRDETPSSLPADQTRSRSVSRGQYR